LAEDNKSGVYFTLFANKPFMRSIALSILLSMYISLAGQFQISGHIKDQSTNEALTGVNLYLVEQEKGCISDQYGYYKLDNLPTGSYFLRVSFDRI
jgi:iron complex outermembrane receptor protein